MKASKLSALLEKAIEKYGDIEIKAYSQDYSDDISEVSDGSDFKLRVLQGGGDLPGDSLEESEIDVRTPFGILFYED